MFTKYFTFLFDFSIIFCFSAFFLFYFFLPKYAAIYFVSIFVSAVWSSKIYNNIFWINICFSSSKIYSNSDMFDALWFWNLVPILLGREMLNSDSSYILYPTTSVHLFSLCRSALSLHSNICFFQNICSPYAAVPYPYVELSSKNLWRCLPWLSTVKRRQRGKVLTPFLLVRPGPDSERPSVPFRGRRWTVDTEFTQVRATRRLTALRPALIVLSAWVVEFYNAFEPRFVHQG